MKKNPEDIAYQVLHEVMFAGTDKKSSDAISKLLKQGKIRRIAPKIYTTNFEANGEDIVRRNIFSILGRLYPGAILSHRTAFECMPTSSGDIYLTYKYSRKISLPGVTVHLLEGPPVDANDRPFIDGLYMSHQTRAFLENMQASKNIGGAGTKAARQGASAADGQPRKAGGAGSVPLRKRDHFRRGIHADSERLKCAAKPAVRVSPRSRFSQSACSAVDL